MTSRILSPSEAKFADATHAFELTFEDVAALGAATDGAAIELISVPAGMKAQCTGLVLNTAFDCSGSGNLTLSIGDGGSNTRLTAATQVAVDNTEVLFSAGNGTQYAYLVADTIDAYFDSSGVNLSTYTSGSVTVYLRLIDMNRLPNPATE